MGGSGFRARALVVAGLFSLGSVVGEAPPAAAQEEPTVVVSPHYLTDGQGVGVDISGFPTGDSFLVQCSGTILQPDTQVKSVCGRFSYLPSADVPPSHVDWFVESSFTSYDGTATVECPTDPAGCVVGVVAFDEADFTTVIAQAFAPITFIGFDRAPARQLADGTILVTEGSDVPPGTSSIAQCGQGVLVPDTPPPELVAAQCSAPVPVTVAPDGTFQAELTVHDPLTSTSGARVPCGTSGCVVVLSTTDDAVVMHRGIAFGPPTFDVEPTLEIREGRIVGITLGGVPDGAQVFQCALPLGDTLESSRCANPVSFELDDWGGTSTAAVPRWWLEATPDPVDCRAQPCGMALFDSSGAPLAEPVPITFARPSLTLEPAEGLLDGQAMTLRAENLPQWSAAYRLLLCAGPGLGPCRLVWRDYYPPEDGRVEATAYAVQQFTDEYERGYAYCRASCRYVLSTYAGLSLEATYTMATGELTAKLARRLHDGQRVQVTATQLMSTYAGAPAGPFPTGGWALTQCDSAILDQPDLLGVFRHCALGPPTQPVGVEGSTLDTTLDVKATIPKILGGDTDCTTGPGACVVGLVRLEQDLSVSTHLVPVTFRT